MINAKTKERVTSKLKRYQTIVTKAVNNDVNESDTVTIITDILSDVFGFDKFSNLTSEYAIRKTFCDLAIKVNNKIPLLIECKAVGINLKDEHIRQATNYAAELGTDWVVLTNAKEWKVYKVIFSQPIDKQLVYEFNLLDLQVRSADMLELLYPLCVEAFPKGNPDGLDSLYEQKSIFNRYVIGRLLLDEDMLGALKRKFKKLFPEMKIDAEALKKLIEAEVLKRDVLDPEQSKDAIKLIKKAEKKMAKKAAKPEKEGLKE